MDRNSQTLRQDQKTTLRLTPLQLRVGKLLELTAPELDDVVSRELEENPALEADDREEEVAPKEDSIRDWRAPSPMPMRRDGREEQPVWQDADDRVSLYDELNRQIDERPLPKDVAETAHFIIGNLDSNGYLTRPLPKIIDDMAFTAGVEVTPETAEEAFQAVRSLEPYGIGATDPRDCLLIQLNHMPPSQTRDDAIEILVSHYEALSKKHTHAIVSGMRVGAERVTRAVDLIKSLNPLPGASLGSGAGTSAPPVIPDAIVSRGEYGELTISLNNSIPELRISESYDNAMREIAERARERRETREAGGQGKVIARYYNDAREFIRVLRMRQDTFFSVVGAIVRIQRDFFETEDELRLRPMMIKDIAAITGQDLSVISRATKNKYLATDTDIYPMRYFFSENKSDGDDETTNRELEAVIRRIVGAEDKRHPLSDEKICELMHAEGYTIKRRTVAKYRDRLGIPVARLRKPM